LVLYREGEELLQGRKDVGQLAVQGGEPEVQLLPARGFLLPFGDIEVVP